MDQGSQDNNFLEKYVVVRLLNDFCLYGKILEITPTYFILQTKDKTSIISFVNIKEINLDQRYGIDAR